MLRNKHCENRAETLLGYREGVGGGAEGLPSANAILSEGDGTAAINCVIVYDERLAGCGMPRVHGD